MPIDAFDPRGAIRNPTSPVVRWSTPADTAQESPASIYLEVIFLGCVLVAVASVLPLVMFLHG